MDPTQVAQQFKESGGILITLGRDIESNFLGKDNLGENS